MHELYTGNGAMQIQTSPCTTIGYTDTPCLILSDPGPDLVIDQGISEYISNYLQFGGNLMLRSSSNIVLTDRIEWHNCNRLTFMSQNNITLTESAYITLSGTLELKAGIEGDGTGRMIFEKNGYYDGAQIDTNKNLGKVVIHYNPEKGKKAHKYHNSNNYYYKIKPESPTDSYMLVNTIQDLQDIYYSLADSYALSQDIEYQNGITFSSGQNRFLPITMFNKKDGTQRGFAGSLDGNGYKIKDLEISIPKRDDIGLFSRCDGLPLRPVKIFNIVFEDCNITGKYRVGTVCGHTQYTEIKNISIKNCIVNGTDYLGGAVGSAVLSKLEEIVVDNLQLTPSVVHKGILTGGALDNTFKDCSGSANNYLVGADMELICLNNA